MNMAPLHAIVLFAHGSRDPLWHRPMQAVAQKISSAAPGSSVVCAYLELSTPDLPTAMAGLVAAGINSVSIVPLFLGVGKHAREDLPKLATALRLQYPELEIRLRPAVGEDPRLIALLADISIEG
jgi:sirohydrochlorin cobaltochelatase